MPPAESSRSRLVAACAALLDYVHPRTGRWSTPTGEAWQPAVAIDAVLLAFELTRDEEYLAVVDRSFRRYRGRQSAFVDDDGWYLNAWLRAYELTGHAAFLGAAQALFGQMTTFWDGVCGGGLWWRKDRSYKNAITNELFVLAAARLHRLTGDQAYLDWATDAWAWFRQSGMINSDHLVNDGLDPSCTNNGQPTWTYNQGVILDALVQLWRSTADDDVLARAGRIADAAIRSLVDRDGILCEPGQPEARNNKDAYVFKGIFAHGLARLAVARPGTTGPYHRFLHTNADRAWSAARDSRGRIGLDWAGPPTRADAATQTSATLLLGGAALLDASPPTTGSGPGRR